MTFWALDPMGYCRKTFPSEARKKWRENKGSLCTAVGGERESRPPSAVSGRMRLRVFHSDNAASILCLAFSYLLSVCED